MKLNKTNNPKRCAANESTESCAQESEHRAQKVHQECKEHQTEYKNERPMSSKTINSDYGTKPSDFYQCDKPANECEICKPFPANSNYDPDNVVYLGKLWEDRHKTVGQAYKNNKDLVIFSGPKCEIHSNNASGKCGCDDHNDRLGDCQHNIDKYNNLNKLCRYCLMAPWSEQHKQICMFIPIFVLEGKDEPPACISNQTSFHGHYVRKTDTE